MTLPGYEKRSEFLYAFCVQIKRAGVYLYAFCVQIDLLVHFSPRKEVTILQPTNYTDEREAPARAEKQGGPFYRPELDMLRFFAFLCVFMRHGLQVNLLTGKFSHYPAIGHLFVTLGRIGGYGLPLFFFLSAFLITTLLLLEKQKKGQVHLRSFYLRRILRIWPLYLTFLILMYILGLLWGEQYFSIQALMAFLLISGNWYIVMIGPLPTTIFFLWSISVEEQFYLVWPTFVRKLKPRGIQLVCITLFALSLSFVALLAAKHTIIDAIWYHSTVQMLFFAGGGLMALRIGLSRQRKGPWRSIGAMIGGAALWFIADAFIGNRNVHIAEISATRATLSYVFTCLGCAALLWSFLQMPERWLHLKLIYLGRISYGLYVFQGIALVLAGKFIQPHLKGGLWLPFALIITVLIAIPSYEFLEKPFLKLKHRFEFVHSRPA